jgi:molybdopterin/thiamine biosynthesis adenylyltransferase/rhodanese-related sulfurtransferase
MSNLTPEEYQRYSRHLLLPEVGLSGQRKLKEAAVLVVGSGGLGSPAALYLAASGIGRLGVVDFDRVDESNLQRQVLHDRYALGRKKVESARERLTALNPSAQVEAYDALLDAHNAAAIAEGYDVLLDGSDNFPTRYLLNDLAVLTGRPLVYGSVFRFEGQVSVFDARVGPCYRCLFPKPPTPGVAPACGEAGVLGALPGIIGSLQATEAIKLLLGIGQPLIGRLLMVDALDMSFRSVRLRKNPACPVCGEHPNIDHLEDTERFCGVTVRGETPGLAVPEVEPAEVARRLQQGEALRLLDVRDPVETQVSQIAGALHLPASQAPLRLEELDRQVEWIVFCRSGERSTRVVQVMRAAGLRAANLKGGINAWAEQVDPSLPRY